MIPNEKYQRYTLIGKTVLLEEPIDNRVNTKGLNVTIITGINIVCEDGFLMTRFASGEASHVQMRSNGPPG